MDPAELRPVLDRVEQGRRYGLDCGDIIGFDAGSWAPGREHVRQLFVRNVSQRTVKFKYELPRTKYFSMNFPTLITLSPGMFTTLNVTFRPVKLEDYDDFVGFHVHVIEGGVAAVSGRFLVPVKARIAALKVDLPHGVDFGFCPTKETTFQSFILHNCGQIDALFTWTLPAAKEHGSPFAIEPESGRVKAGERIELTAKFYSPVASVYVITTSCTIKPDATESIGPVHTLTETMKISSISKFTHVSASETELNFGEVLVGAADSSRAPTEKVFVLRNRSLVRASFNIQELERDHDSTFNFTPLTGVVDAESSLTIRVRYTPLSAGTFTCDHFDIVTPGGNRVRMTCKGRAVGPTLSIWRKTLESNFLPTTSVNFQDVAVGGKAVSRVLTLRNESPVELSFQFDCQSQGVFCFHQNAGTIPPFLDLNVTISFSPLYPGNFYRRFFLLLHNQSTRFVDVLGTGYDEKIRPSPFQQAHIDAYRLRAAAGLARLSPDELETYHTKNGDAMFLKGALQHLQAEDDRSRHDTDSSVSQLFSPSHILTRSGEASVADVKVCSEYFINIEDETNPVLVQGAIVDFGSCSLVQLASKKLLFVTNNTHSKVTCSWQVAVATGIADSSVFQVFPATSDIAAGATIEFRVAFQPTRINTYYFAELEAFVSFKSNRTFRLVNVETFTPPWCLVAKTCGNTFASSTQQFLSRLNYNLIKKKVHFPPCYLGDSVFQTVMMENTSDTPAIFRFNEDPSGVFSCKPLCGYIDAKSFHLVMIRFTPRSVQKYACLLKCVVNNLQNEPEELELSAICALPQLSFQDIEAGQLLPFKAKVHIKPTSIGLQSIRQIELINTSRVPLVYRCELPSMYQHVFHVKPKLGRLNGRESTFIECTFTPDEIREYVCRMLVAAKSISIPLQESKSFKSKIPVLQELTIRVQSKGTTGAILFQPQTLRFETILVNSSSRQSFFIENTADCDLTYSLQQTVVAETTNIRRSDGNDANMHEEDKKVSRSVSSLVFSQAEGCIPAQSRKKITATFSSSSPGLYTFKVSCVVGNQTAGSPYDSWELSKLKQASCLIQAEASFPSLYIQDLRVPGLSTQLAWQQFQCNAINEYLAAPLTKKDSNVGTTTATNESNNPEVDELEDETTIKRFALSFSPAPLGSRTEQVFIELMNPGSLVVQYRLRLPNEGTVEIEHWAETGAPSAADVRLNTIIDSQVFRFSPRQAKLLPRQSILLTLSYSYISKAFGGNHSLPLVLEVDKGKTVVLELRGQTLLQNHPKLFLPSQVFHLSPVTIGEFRPSFSRRVDSDQSVQFDPNRPPMQQIEVFNCGESAMRLQIGSASFSRINSANYGYRVLACNSNSEIVPAKSSIFLNLEFNPINVGTIKAPLLLKAQGLMGKEYNEMTEITIVATGYDPKEFTLREIKSKLWTSLAPPTKQACWIPDLPACFVSDLVELGHVSMHSEASQLLILRNKSQLSSRESPRRFVFEWDASHPLVANDTIAFSPKCGELGPGDKALIRVTVHAGGDAFVLNHDVACMITYSEDWNENSGSNAETKSSRGLNTGTTILSNQTRDTNSRMSIIHRSTATQEAVVDKRDKLSTFGRSRKALQTQPPPISMTHSSSFERPLMESSRKMSPQKTETLISSDSRQLDVLGVTTALPLFVRINAHILPVDVMERIYSREELRKMPLPATKQVPRVSPVPASTAEDEASPSVLGTRETSTSTKNLTTFTEPSDSKSRIEIRDGATSKVDRTACTSMIEPAAAECRDVLYDVMETLVMDVLTCSTIQEALNEQLVPLARSDGALRHAAYSEGAATRLPPESLYHDVRKDNDCQAIVAGLMENTVFNIVQELFYEDLEHESF